MSVNPFEDPAPSPIARVFSEATTAAKQSVLADISDMAKAASSLNSQVKIAKKTGNVHWLKRLEGYATRLVSALAEFVKKAIELAIFKLVLELCAMIMNSIMAALTSRGNQRIEITTPGVYLTPQGSTTQGQQQPSRPTSNPFAGPFGSTSAVVEW